MGLSTRVERDRHTLHPTSPITFHAERIEWDFFGTLTFRVVPPDHIQLKCVFEYLRRCLKEFHSEQDIRWSTYWMLRKEQGGKYGRVHWHFLLALDKLYANSKANCKALESIWSKQTASRQVGRYNKEAENHNRTLRRELRYKSPEVRRDEYEARCRSYIRNDYSSPGYAKVREYDPRQAGVAYLMKEDDWTFSGANAHELSKFGSEFNADLCMSHKLLWKLFLKANGRKTTQKGLRDFRKLLVSSLNPSRNGPQDTFTRTPNASSQLWDDAPEFRESVEPWFKSQY